MMRTLTPFLSVLIAILLFLFFTQPQYQEVKVLQKSISEYEEATERYNEFVALLEQKLSVKTSRSAYESERLDRLVPDSIDDTRMLVDLEALTKRHGMFFGNVETTGGEVEIRNKTEDSRKTSNDLQTVDISFGIIGTYEQFKSFLRDLESSVTLYEVTDLNYIPNEGVFQQFALTVRSFALPN